MASCRKIRQTLSAYQDKEVGQLAADVTKDHLDTCETCRKEYDILIETCGLVKVVPEAEPPVTLFQQIMDGADRPGKTVLKHGFTNDRWLLPGLPVPSGMAALAATGLFLGIMLGNLLSDSRTSLSLLPPERSLHQAPLFSSMAAFDSTPPGSFAGSYLKLVSVNPLTR